MEQAAKQAMRYAKDKKSPEYTFASRYLTAIQLLTLDKADFKAKQAIYQNIAGNLIVAEIHPDDLDIASAFAEGLEQIGDFKLARQVYLNFSQVIQRRKNNPELLVDLAKSFDASARRLDLVGKQMQVVGTTSTGQKFDFSRYRGRVVLVDFGRHGVAHVWPRSRNSKNVWSCIANTDLRSSEFVWMQIRRKPNNFWPNVNYHGSTCCRRIRTWLTRPQNTMASISCPLRF